MTVLSSACDERLLNALSAFSKFQCNRGRHSSAGILALEYNNVLAGDPHCENEAIERTSLLVLGKSLFGISILIKYIRDDDHYGSKASAKKRKVPQLGCAAERKSETSQKVVFLSLCFLVILYASFDKSLLLVGEPI